MSIYVSSTGKKKALRASETYERRNERLKAVRIQTAQANEQRESRLKTDRRVRIQARSDETIDQRKTRLATTNRDAMAGPDVTRCLNLAAFNYKSL